LVEGSAQALLARQKELSQYSKTPGVNYLFACFMNKIFEIGKKKFVLDQAKAEAAYAAKRVINGRETMTSTCCR